MDACQTLGQLQSGEVKVEREAEEEKAARGGREGRGEGKRERSKGGKEERERREGKKEGEKGGREKKAEVCQDRKTVRERKKNQQAVHTCIYMYMYVYTQYGHSYTLRALGQ